MCALIMKCQAYRPFAVLIAAFALFAWSDASAQQAKPVEKASSETVANREAIFTALFTEAYLSGRWAPLKEGALGEEKSGDKYHVVSVAKVEGDKWTLRATLKYRDQELVIPIPVLV